MTCEKRTYVSFGLDEDEMYRLIAECDGFPDCGWGMLLREEDRAFSWGITDEEIAALDAEHRRG